MAKKLKSQPVGVRSSSLTSHTHAQVHSVVQKFFAGQDNEFHCCDGARLSSVWQLAEHLRSMHQESYAYHASDHKNDFASWLRDVHGEHALADRLLSAKSKEHAAKLVAGHIVNCLHDAAHR
ncbi:hypothetical protein HY641_04200 [Candidatus Woesearchaeota archaeon]|nr:hypothetical protein [Candidatus Woesearchaeota archaeon]